MTKINLRIISKPHAYFQTMTKIPVEFQKDCHKTVGGVAHKRYSVPTIYTLFWKMTLVQNAEKVTKINLRIISKPHAYLQTMTKTPVEFQKDCHKTVGGVAHTRYPLCIHFDSIQAWKNEVQNAKKVTKNILRIISKPDAYLQGLTWFNFLIF